jgi:Mn-dependent DtxR family transcriptional regulator
MSGIRYATPPNKLLLEISRNPLGLSSRSLGVATRAADKVRQKLRRDELIIYENRGNGSRWFITPKGRAFLDDILKTLKEENSHD